MKSKFNLACTLSAASDTSGGAWTVAQIDLVVADNDGVWLGTDVAVGDVVILDTGSFEPGTVTEYMVSSFIQRAASAVRLSVTLRTTDHAAPDLSYAIGSRGYLARPTASRGLVSVPSPGTQGLPDKLSFSGHNRNAALLDMPVGATEIVLANGRLSTWKVGGHAFAATYGANGLESVTRGGVPYLSITYTNGQPSAVTYA